MPNFRVIDLFSGEYNMQYINPDAVPVPNMPGWYSLPDFPHYAISEDGQIWSFSSNRFLQQEIQYKGYNRVDLWNNGKRSRFSVHRLVGWVFVPLPPEFNGNYNIATINHKDHNRTNNHYTNLEWVTREYNAQEAWFNGYINRDIITRKRPCFCIDAYSRIYTEFDKVQTMAEYIGTSYNALKHLCNRRPIINNRYIVGYLDDPIWQELFANLSINDLCEAYLYDNRESSPFLVTDLVTNETTQYNSFIDASKDISIDRKVMSTHIKSGEIEPLQGRYSMEYLSNVMNSYYHNC